MHAILKDLSPEQKIVYSMAVNDRRSIFFTGAAGTGKSRVLDAIVLGLEARRRGRRDEYPDDRVAVIAPTGMAASLIRGKTLHAWAGIPPGAEFSSTVLEVRKNMNPRALERWTHVWVIVIDEVSMVSAKLFSFMAALTRLLRPQKAIRATWAKRPVHKRFSKASKVACAADWPTCQTLDCPQNNTFGGIQLVVTGDFLQLPPVAPREEEEKTAAAPRTGRGPASQKRAAPAAAGLSVSRPDFAFKSKDCKGQFFAECQLKQIFRQNDGRKSCLSIILTPPRCSADTL